MAKYKGYENEKVEKTIELSDFSEIRVTSLSDFENNLKGVDIRQWYCTQEDPIKKPTKKGIRLNVDALHLLTDVLVSLLDD